ncbi:IS66 family insertion sequence element accessory protein TnpB [Vibrio metschnikovii]|nr:IS66 family insertion sequence element accessory protein TnpB [Vibrio metschnikovii]EKO3926062.1 IS66 family insertion sequence element accessory protein TnpB [Vibrio metschnikovii]
MFCNRGRGKIKILFWDTNGFWLYYRRLVKGRFKWPKRKLYSIERKNRELSPEKRRQIPKGKLVIAPSTMR